MRRRGFSLVEVTIGLVIHHDGDAGAIELILIRRAIDHENHD